MNPHGYESGFTIEQHIDELIARLGSAIKTINEAQAQLAAKDAVIRRRTELLTDSTECLGYLLDELMAKGTVHSSTIGVAATQHAAAKRALALIEPETLLAEIGAADAAKEGQ